MRQGRVERRDGKAEGVKDWPSRVSGCSSPVFSLTMAHLIHSEWMVNPVAPTRSTVFSDPPLIIAEALVKLTASDLAKHLQVTDDNPMDGLEGRAGLLSALGKALLAKPEFYKSGRPGDMLGRSSEKTFSFVD